MEFYKVFSPLTGNYQNTETLEEAEKVAPEIAWLFYVAHSHNNPISQVTINNDGTEVWGAHSEQGTTKHKIFSPVTGLYVTADTLEQAKIVARRISWNFYISHCNCEYILKVTRNGDGTEVLHAITNDINQPIIYDITMMTRNITTT